MKRTVVSDEKEDDDDFPKFQIPLMCKEDEVDKEVVEEEDDDEVPDCKCLTSKVLEGRTVPAIVVKSRSSLKFHK